jgi:hypothetical protein
VRPGLRIAALLVVVPSGDVAFARDHGGGDEGNEWITAQRLRPRAAR